METTRDFTKIDFSDDSVLVYQPRYTDESRTRVRAILVMPNGQLIETEKSVDDRESRFVRDIFLQYTEAEIWENTRRELVMLEKKRLASEELAARQAREAEKAMTFQAKVKALEMPEVRDFPDKRVSRRIRRAKSPFEVAALVTLVLQESFKNDEAQA